MHTEPQPCTIAPSQEAAMFLVSLAEGFIHLFQAAGIIFLDMMTGLIPMLICLLLAINFLMKLEAGRILRGHISMDDVISVPTEWLDWAGASSPVWFLGSHCFDLVRHLSGQEVVSVYAVGQKRLMVECGLDTFDSVQSLLTMADGSSWVMENSWVLPEGFPKDNDGRIDILCKATYIRSTSQHRGLEITTPGMTLTPNSYFINYRNGVASGFGIDSINDFVRAVIHKAPYPVTAVDGLAVSRICEAVHQSLDSQKPMSLK